jgi:hypothetical protein
MSLITLTHAHTMQHGLLELEGSLARQLALQRGGFALLLKWQSYGAGLVDELRCMALEMLPRVIAVPACTSWMCAMLRQIRGLTREHGVGEY